MINHATIAMKKVVERFKGFEGIKRLVHVSGGLDISINLITSKYPHIKGINFDLVHALHQILYFVKVFVWRLFKPSQVN
ncbi:putative O-methyltransferase COMT-type [Lupinus albus]|uniref:Putative O-methyltransferase COMT-type n=1 Tax=Lupinus albus TaxID=3870 RepID=A0A6A4PAY1_LUPAL|nr:putative O-methyltransferase COMT-type [Lupinus albus]